VTLCWLKCLWLVSDSEAIWLCNAEEKKVEKWKWLNTLTLSLYSASNQWLIQWKWYETLFSADLTEENTVADTNWEKWSYRSWPEMISWLCHSWHSLLLTCLSLHFSFLTWKGLCLQWPLTHVKSVGKWLRSSCRQRNDTWASIEKMLQTFLLEVPDKCNLWLSQKLSEIVSVLSSEEKRYVTSCLLFNVIIISWYENNQYSIQWK
jgi:hypothetical protein